MTMIGFQHEFRSFLPLIETASDGFYGALQVLIVKDPFALKMFLLCLVLTYVFTQS